MSAGPGSQADQHTAESICWPPSNAGHCCWPSWAEAASQRQGLAEQEANKQRPADHCRARSHLALLSAGISGLRISGILCWQHTKQLHSRWGALAGRVALCRCQAAGRPQSRCQCLAVRHCLSVMHHSLTAAIACLAVRDCLAAIRPASCSTKAAQQASVLCQVSSKAHILVCAALMGLLAGARISVQHLLHFITAILREGVIRGEDDQCHICIAHDAELHGPPHQA